MKNKHFLKFWLIVAVIGSVELTSNAYAVTNAEASDPVINEPAENLTGTWCFSPFASQKIKITNNGTGYKVKFISTIPNIVTTTPPYNADGNGKFTVPEDTSGDDAHPELKADIDNNGDGTGKLTLTAPDGTTQSANLLLCR